MTMNNCVVIETGEKKVFASALDWPGWSRSGKTEGDALRTLADYAGRYRKVAELAGLDGVQATADEPGIIEHLEGSGATDFGVPERVAAREREPMTDAECERQIRLLHACWVYFDDTASRVSVELQRGPRGGGRDRDRIIEHVIEADRGYARKIGVRTPPFDVYDRDAVAAHRAAVFAAMPPLKDGELVANKGWPIRYFIRRAAWHVLDHAWEMEDKDLTANHA